MVGFQKKGFTKHWIEWRGIYDSPYLVYLGKEPKLTAYIYKKSKTLPLTLIDANLARFRNTILTLIEANLTRFRLTRFRNAILPYYDQFVIKYKPLKVYNKVNLLLQITKNKYVYIGNDIIEFTIKDDTIKQFYTPVTGSYPYPVAFGNNYVYFMAEGFVDKVPIKYFDGLTKTEKANDAYQYYYGHEGNEPLKKYAKKVENQKKIK